MIDSAWGTHFGLTARTPPFLLDCGADVVTTSDHKTFLADEQAAIVYLGADDQGLMERLNLAFQVQTSTSPSSQLLASLDASLETQREAGTRLVEDARVFAEALRQTLAWVPGLHVLDLSDLGADRERFAIDPLKVFVKVAGLGFTGRAPVEAKVYQLQKLRCNLCGKLFTAQPPEGVGSAKYHATAGSMIALLKYGTGLPFNRFQGRQGNLGIPLPASTHWDIVHAQAKHLEPVHAELIRQASEGDVLHNDDTTIKILELMGKRARPKALAKESGEGARQKASERSGLFTLGIVSTRDGRRIALFFSGRQHAGENLKDVLAQRAADLAAPIQMCDALSRNLPGELKTILANCLAHWSSRALRRPPHVCAVRP